MYAFSSRPSSAQLMHSGTSAQKGWYSPPFVSGRQRQGSHPWADKPEGLPLPVIEVAVAA
jgi:hypothetical protein